MVAKVFGNISSAFKLAPVFKRMRSAVCVASWCVACTLPATAASLSAFLIHTNQFSGAPLVGFGVQISPYITAPDMPQPIGNLHDLQQKVNALAPQHVRIFVLTKWWQPGSEPYRDSFIRSCQIAQDAGAAINVTLLSSWQSDPAAASKAMAQLLDDLIRKRSLTAVQYVTLQNEVNSTRITMENYNKFYRMFDQDLQAVGLRNRIKIVGGDLVRNNQKLWFQNLGSNLADICDGYSVHMYWNYWAAADNIPRRTREIMQTALDLPSAQRRPIFITEFGVRGRDWQTPGKEPGFDDQGVPMARTAIQPLQIAWLITEATRRGFVATIQWDLWDLGYPKNHMHFGLLGEGREGWPIRPAYHVLRLFTHTISPGWRAVQIQGESAGVAVTATQGPKGEITFIAVNHSTNAQEISIAGLPTGTLVHDFAWVATNKDRLCAIPDFTNTATPLRISMTSQSIVALTTRPDRWQILSLTPKR